MKYFVPTRDFLERDYETLAKICLNLIKQTIDLDFNGSNPAYPSPVVKLIPRKKLIPGTEGCLPVSFSREFWEDIIIPVLSKEIQPDIPPVNTDPVWSQISGVVDNESIFSWDAFVANKSLKFSIDYLKASLKNQILLKTRLQ